MSDREKAKALIDQVPESEMYCVLSYLQNVVMPEDVSENVPNEETIASMEELEKGGGILFKGSTEDLFTELMGE